MYFINKLRVLKNYNITKAENARAKLENLRKAATSKKSSDSIKFTGYVEVIMNKEQPADKTQVMVA